MSNSSTPQQEFDRAVRWMASEIRKESLATSSDKNIYFEYQNSKEVPSREDQRRAIQFLEKEKAIKITSTKGSILDMMDMFSGYKNTKVVGFYIDILQPRLDEISREEKPYRPAVYFERFDPARGSLYLAGEQIEISKSGKETYQLQLLTTLTKESNRFWFKDEILTDWNYSEEEQVTLPKNRVYQAAVKINNQVAQKTQINDFLEFTTEKFRINPKYLIDS